MVRLNKTLWRDVESAYRYPKKDTAYDYSRSGYFSYSYRWFWDQFRRHVNWLGWANSSSGRRHIFAHVNCDRHAKACSIYYYISEFWSDGSRIQDGGSV